jgi:putative FmdB family regulatory protein
MPTYEYACNGCGHEFSLVKSVKEHDREKVKCPKCRSQDVKHNIQSVFVKTSRKG